MVETFAVVWSIDVITLILFAILLIIFVYGQIFQGWQAGRQIVRGRNVLRRWKQRGVKLIHSLIEPISPETITPQDIDAFIEEMLNFFVITPANLDPPHYEKIHFLLERRETRFRELIRQFLPNIDDLTLSKLTGLLLTTMELENTYKKVQHKYLQGKKNKSYWYLLQTAAEMVQVLSIAKAYSRALESFMDSKPIGDSIGPLSLHQFIQESNQSDSNEKDESSEKLVPSVTNLTETMIGQSISFENRECICVRAKGPAALTGNPGEALKQVFIQCENENKDIKLILSIDSILRLEGENSGTIAQGIGVAIGGGSSEHLDQYQIETLAINHNPPIPTESIVCRESLEESVNSISESISRAIPKIVRMVKQIIRSQTQPGEVIVILGIGNALGVEI